MRSTQRITVVLHIDLEETQAADVHDVIHGSRSIQSAISQLGYLGQNFVEEHHEATGEATSYGVHVEHTTRYLP